MSAAVCEWEKGEGKEIVTTYKVLRFRPLVLLVVVVIK